MGFMATAMVAFGWTMCFMSTAESGACPLGTVVIHITSAADVENLTDALACVGQGLFDITWHSSLTIDEGIEVADDKNVTVTGDALGDDNVDGVVIDAGSGTGIFSVSNGSTLHLNNIGLEGGNAKYGGAVAVYSSSSLFVFGCTFTRNTASNGGEPPRAGCDANLGGRCHSKIYYSAPKLLEDRGCFKQQDSKVPATHNACNIYFHLTYLMNVRP